jgi:hypothetical protein
LIINNELERTWKEERKPGEVRQYSDYITDWTVRGLNPGRGKYFTFKNVQTGSGTLPASYSVSTRLLPEGLSGQAPRLKVSAAIPLLPQHAFME